MPKMGKGYLPLLYIPDGAGRYAKLPVLTTTQRNALTGVEGMIIFNSTTDQLEEYDGATWEAVGQVAIDTHTADADAHHSEQVADGRGRYNSTNLLSTLAPQSALGSTTVQISGDRDYMWPAIVRTPVTIDQVTVEVTTNAGAGHNGRFALYKADINWQPTDLVIASAEFAIDVIAVVDTALTETVLQEGRYLKILNFESTASVLGWRYTPCIIGYIATLGANAQPRTIYIARSYAAFPSTGTVWTTPTVSSEGTNDCIFLNVKTP